MNRRYLFFALAPLLLLVACGGGDVHDDPAAEVAATTLVHVGDQAPDFALDLAGGGRFDLADQRGKVVLVNFFATWCPPCQAEMPHLREQIFERFAGDDFVLVSVAREETAAEVVPFAAKYEAGWPFALDTDRAAFARWAESYIPRNFVLDRQGRVIYQAQGYEAEEFAEMVAVIAGAIASVETAAGQ